MKIAKTHKSSTISSPFLFIRRSQSVGGWARTCLEKIGELTSRYQPSIYNLFVTLTLLFTATQCQTQPLPQITGKVALTEGWKPTLYLIQPRRFADIAASFSGLVIDSAGIAPDGSFAFSRLPQNEEKTLLEICIQKTGSRFANQLVDNNPLLANYMPLVLQKGESVDIFAEAARFQATFSIKNPSAENLALLQLRTIRHAAYTQQDLSDQAEDHSDESKLLEHEDALYQFQRPLMAFADSTVYWWPALVAARWVSPSGDYERVPEFMVDQCQKWRGRMAANPWVEQFCQTASREKLPLLIGDTMPDYALPMLSGDTTLVHSLLGSRITILDIWASWCAPCRRENREILVPLWAKYQGHGLQILGYSIDSDAAAWKAAIAKDGATWPHASHLSGDATPFLEVLRITTIPANFILNAQGKVIAKNLHGEALRAFVAGYLK